MSFPIFLCRFSSENLLISNDFVIMMLQIFVWNDIVVFKILILIFFNFHLLHIKLIKTNETYFKFFAFWSFLWSIIVMLFERIITYNIVINQWVSFRPEIPWFFFGVVRSILQSSKFVFKVDHIECLFITKGIIFVLCKYLYKIVMFSLSCDCFNLFVCVDLRYWVISCLLFLNGFWCNFFVNWSDTLKFLLFF